MKIHVDTTDLPSEPGDYAVVTVPGGAKGAATLSKSAPVQSLLQKFEKAVKLVGTICAGSLVVKTSGLVAGGKVTSHPSVEKFFGGYEYSEDRVVVEGDVVSSRGYTAWSGIADFRPGTAIEWSLKMVELLSGKAKRDEVAGEMVLHPAIA
jgi:protein DJ-1